MKCNELQFNLPLYAEDELEVSESSILAEHLLHCPVCRVKLSEFQNLRKGLRAMSKPQIPADLLSAVRGSVAAQLTATQPQSWFNLSEEWRDWLMLRLMPYSVGTVVSLFLVVAFFISLASTRESTDKVIETARVNSNRAVILTNLQPTTSDNEFSITKEDYAALRIPVSGESPSLNPKGAFLTFTKALVRGKMKNDEVTFVADVFGNGLAQIAEVVEAPPNQKSLRDLSNALENDPDYAPFVSADLDNRSDVIRVVFKIQRVEVIDKNPAKKKHLR